MSSIAQKFQVKYGWKGLEIRNNFPYRNFSRFEMKFEPKIKELLWVENSLENSLENLGTLDFDEIWTTSFLLHLISRKKKSIFIKRGYKIWISLKKKIRIDFTIVWILNFIFEFHLLS
jgi:hypothetical protein